VVARGAHQVATHAGVGPVDLARSDVVRGRDKVDRARQLIEEEVWRSEPVLAPPLVDVEDIRFRVWTDDDLARAHRRARRSAQTSAAGRPLPALMLSIALSRCWCRQPWS
jgi:hypothetical protein